MCEKIRRGAAHTLLMTYKFRISPSEQQVAILEEREQQVAILEERLKYKGLKYYEQKTKLAQKRKIIATLQNIHSQLLQDVI